MHCPSISGFRVQTATLQMDPVSRAMGPYQPMCCAGFSNLQSIDALAVRLWLDKRVPLATPSNVLVGFDR